MDTETMPVYPGALEPGDAAILERAKAWEAEHPDEEGWRWLDVRALPAHLVRLVIRGRIRVVRPRKPPREPTRYRLVKS